MLKVAITGGIGSGKTTICKLFQGMGAPIYLSDERAAWLENNDPELIKSIKLLFGDSIYVDGIFDKPTVRKIVFTDKKALQDLSSLVTPALMKDFQKFCEKNAKSPYVLFESAIVIEQGKHHWFDVLIVVTAPEAERIKRAMSRDKCDEEMVRKRINNQMSEERKVQLADIVIENYGKESHEILDQVKKIHESLLRKDQGYAEYIIE